MTKKNEIIGMFELCGAFFLAGCSIVIGKQLTSKIPLFLLSNLVIFIALILLTPFLIRNRKELFNLKWRDIILIVLQAISGIVATRVLTLLGLRFTTGFEAGIIYCSTPAVMAIFAIFILRERFSVFQYVGIVLAVSGMVIANISDSNDFNGFSSIKGNLIIFCSIICEVLMTILRKKSRERVSPITNAALLFWISFILFLPFAVKDFIGYDFKQLTYIDFGLILFYGLMGSGLAYILWSSGAKKSTGVMAGASIAMIPLTAVTLSILILNEKVTKFHLIGAVAAILGMVFTTLRAKENKIHLPKKEVSSKIAEFVNVLINHYKN